MLYKYDQLHRITKSRSLTSYSEGTGFAARTATPAPYDETYTYDANGNILTLNRMNGEGVLLDDFNYKYYGGSNKLRGVKPITRDTIYNGTINSPGKLYRNITLQGGALAANGNSATLKATERIAIDPSFAAEEGTDFAAYIPEEGPFIYDAIGNLIADEDEGVKISWTPYGKIREVKTKSDSVTVKFRYDGTGNRIEKRVEKYDTTLITRYVRDVSGNVMSIYADTSVTEQPIYGSSRLGMYRGGVLDAHQTLGRRSYELSNHLGNVLAVVTDNIGMNTEDTVWASVESSGDYYAFGMGMKERSYSSGEYRYGFNGKENDEETGTQDYGFRIYNPRIAKFLSVDPLTKDFPELTPYQFASNTPIQAIDLDGLEKLYYFKAQRKQLTGLDLALKILNHSGIMQELKKSFEQDNSVSDIYINIRPEPENRLGKTNPILEDVELNETTLQYFQITVSENIVDTDQKLKQVTEVSKNTLEKNKRVIFIDINQSEVEKAEKDKSYSKEIAMVIAHEILVHGIDQKDNKDDNPSDSEHKEFYNDPEFYKKWSGDYSPAYKEIKPNSKAGELKQRIEKSAEELNIQ